jgi:hypothetical protein
MNELFALQDKKASWRLQRTAMANIFKADDVEISALAKIVWPVDIKPLIDKLLKDKLVNRQTNFNAAHAADEISFKHTLNEFVPECHEANAVRAALGLQTAGGDCS